MAGLLLNSVGLCIVVLASFHPPLADEMKTQACGRQPMPCVPYELECKNGFEINITQGYFVKNKTVLLDCSRDFQSCSKNVKDGCCKETRADVRIYFNDTELNNVINQCVSQRTCYDIEAPYRRKYILSYLVYNCEKAPATVKPDITTTVLSTVQPYSSSISLFSLSTATQPTTASSVTESHSTSAETAPSGRTAGTTPSGPTLPPISAAVTDATSLTKNTITIIIGTASAVVVVMTLLIIVCCIVKRRKRSSVDNLHKDPEIDSGKANLGELTTKNYDHAYTDVTDNLSIVGRDDNTEYDHIGQKEVAVGDHYDTTASAAKALRAPDDEGSYDCCQTQNKKQAKLPDNLYEAVKAV